ncbi:hypothetical protein ABIF38_003298 [Bradyrhizobium japonicum]|jgi:hypothetical protein|uniref:Transposase n=1 Tax=Bradyrhizobium elkanii TaxID=29448 RepID=A0ABV4FCD9_BRAEL|nr:hypothetical protein [Bradyrhizobium elkanii]MBP2432296.1 hypothetical protein [Bradyrhizobium elkanii]MCP1734385.1 hypothetical protein [Bradyrhizobium elkanii]MCP1752179.1 hypothetical protein [Bradyrhizobium elkanii]MCP1977952.1 hypothetical protein [Bradyrhizobium elkanii]MCS3569722.1 hypothetical protein [Bradyrhizobium elkanii]
MGVILHCQGLPMCIGEKDANAWSWAHNRTQVNAVRNAPRANVICKRRKRPIEPRRNCS